MYIEPSAPSHATIAGVASQQNIAQNTENVIEHIHIWLAIELACLSCLAPRYCEISIEPAVVIPAPKLIRIFCIGDTSVMAACDSVPILPSQKVSVRLYMDCIKLLSITGMASISIACIRLPSRIIFLLSALIFFAIFIILSNCYNIILILI